MREYEVLNLLNISRPKLYKYVEDGYINYHIMIDDSYKNELEHKYEYEYDNEGNFKFKYKYDRESIYDFISLDMIPQPIIHQGKLIDKIWDEMYNKKELKNKFINDNSLDIIAFNNLKKPILERNLDYLGIKYEKIDPKTDYYYHTMKIEYLYDYFQKYKNSDDIVLIPDCDDVLIIDSLKRILNIFKSFNCKILFMATAFDYPYHCMPKNKQWVYELNGGCERFINGGIHIGYVKDILKLYERALEFIPKDKNKLLTIKQYKDLKRDSERDIKNVLKKFPIGSHDQDIFRWIEPEFYPDLKVDYKNVLAFR